MKSFGLPSDVVGGESATVGSCAKAACMIPWCVYFAIQGDIRRVGGCSACAIVEGYVLYTAELALRQLSSDLWTAGSTKADAGPTNDRLRRIVCYKLRVCLSAKMRGLEEAEWTAKILLIKHSQQLQNGWTFDSTIKLLHAARC